MLSTSGLKISSVAGDAILLHFYPRRHCNILGPGEMRGHSNSSIKRTPASHETQYTTVLTSLLLANFPWRKVEKKRGDHTCADFLFLDCCNSF